MIQDFQERGEPWRAALSEAELAQLKESFRAAQRDGKITILADDTEARIAEAVAAEREACAQLAEQHAATASKCAKGIAPNPSSECGCRACRPRFPFAALLRGAGKGG